MTRAPGATERAAAAKTAAEAEVEVCPDGPLLVRGATHVIDADGLRHAVERPVVAVCRCGSSRRSPWCDGMHKLLKK